MDERVHNYYIHLPEDERKAAMAQTRDFVLAEVAPAVLDAFPDFDIPVDLLDCFQMYHFVDMTRGSRLGIAWSFDEQGKFVVSVGDVKRDMRRRDFGKFEVDGRQYLVVNKVALWYQTEDRQTWYGEDYAKRSEFIHGAIDVVKNYLESLA
jgi:hypothetical protein